MSIEELFKAVVAALEANTKAMIALEASLRGRTPSKSAKPTKAEEAAAIKEEEEPKSDAKDPVEAADANNELNAKHPDDLASEAKTLLPYETARALVLKLANAGKRAEIPQVFKAHGIDNLKKLLDKEDDFSTVNDQAKLEAVYADLQKLEG